MGLPVESTTELFALDSFQNLLFSIARFREYTGHYPTNITVVGYAFKGKRFEELHARALRWPVERLTYIGVELDDKADEAQAAQGEVRLVSSAFGEFVLTVRYSWRIPIGLSQRTYMDAGDLSQRNGSPVIHIYAHIRIMHLHLRLQSSLSGARVMVPQFIQVPSRGPCCSWQ